MFQFLQTVRLFVLPGLMLALMTPHFGIAQAPSVVTVDSNKVLVVNGEKIFPITVSPGPPNLSRTTGGADAMNELRNAGAFMTRIAVGGDWNAQVISDQQVALDWAHTNDMYCMVNLRELSAFASGNTNREAALRQTVNLFKNHPALGVWKNKDEAWWGDTSAEDLKRGYDVIKQEDPNHPVEQTHAPRGTVADLQPYNDAADILAVDIYPVGFPPGANSPLTNKEISMVGDWTDILAEVANGEKQYWMVEQIAWSGVVPPGKTLRFPTYVQSRFMAYQAVIHGARGLMFFGGNVAATLNQEDAAVGWNWTFWNEVLKPVVRQLGRESVLAEALVAPESELPIQATGGVEFCVREVPPYVYILACKREGVTTNVTFTRLPATASLGDVVYESPRIVNATNGVFTDWFAPFDVHVYRFFVPDPAPQIVSQPQSRTNFVGTTATFTVGASGLGPLAYQWRKGGFNLSNGNNVAGSTTRTLTLTSVSTADAGSYDVVVLNGNGSITSAPPATLTVLNYQSNQVPSILTQPQSRTNYPATIATFNVTASNNGPFDYQWRKNGVNLLNGGNLSGATSTNLTLLNVSQNDAGTYDVVVSGFGSVTSASATLNVVAYTTNGLVFYEPFDYANVGGPVSSNTPVNWAFGGAGANDFAVAGGSLWYPGLPIAIGNSATNGGAGLGTRRLLGQGFNSGKLYFSALFRIKDLGVGFWSGALAQVGAFTAPDNVTFRLAVMAKTNSPTAYLLGVQKSSGAVFNTTQFAADETVLLVGKYDFTVSPNSVSLWINPEPSTFGLAAEPTSGFISNTNGADGFAIDRFNFRQNTPASVPAAMQWDELRVGTSWASVTPFDASTGAIILTNVLQLENGSFQFDYLARSGTTNAIHASTNLVEWTSVGNATEVTPGTFRFNDNSAGGRPKRFYQLRRY